MGAVIVIWIACGVLGLLLAKRKGRNPVEGLLLGGLAGFIGLLIEALLPARHPQLPGPGARG